ncbi:uncharacterized protein LOC111619771 [Centruroides sculpturatus]|uniref:uncharacterized protein LOC111619771 n=1 Tax=Centruroides sculpturatus TaxID=218467 RepID=UPI000C6D5CEE|nr:uncharacterized protein LOC111619771 [Centruroides sculpturatus]
MATNENTVSKVSVSETLTSDSDEESLMDMYDQSTTRKRACCGDTSSLTPLARKRRQKSEEVAGVRGRVMSALRNIISELQATCLDRDNKITKFAAEKILDHAGDLQDLVVELLADHEKLQGQLDQQLKLQHNVPSKVTYAEVMNKGAPAPKVGNRASPNKPKHIIFVKPNDSSKLKNSEEVKESFMRIINPRSEQIRFRQVRKLKSRGIMIEVEREGDFAKIMNNSKLHEHGLKTQPLEKRKPRMIIYDIPKNVNEEELLAVIKSMNEEVFAGTTNEEFSLLFKTGKRREEVVNWVAEVSPAVRGKLLSQQRLYIDYNSCKVKDFMAISRCFRCQSYGHIAKFCKDEEDTCSHCAETGHKFTNCPKKKEAAQCAACKKTGKSHGHGRTSKQCTAYKMALERYLNTV